MLQTRVGNESGGGWGDGHTIYSHEILTRNLLSSTIDGPPTFARSGRNLHISQRGTTSGVTILSDGLYTRQEVR